MGLQTAYYNQPYAAPLANPAVGTIPGANANTLASYVIPLQMPSSPPAYPTMTQLPSIPRPPFLNSASSTDNIVTTQSSGLGTLPDIPPPAQVAPSVMRNIGNSTPYNTAQSVSLSKTMQEIPPESEIPPPHMVAPWLYLQRGHSFSPTGLQQSSQQSQISQLPMQAPMQQPQSQQTQSSMHQTSQQKQMPPPQQAPPPQQKQMQPQTPPPQPPQEKKAATESNNGAFSEQVIQSLNDRLEDSDENVRAEAVIDLHKILEVNPKLQKNSKHKETIDAFMDKIMDDPSPLVRGGGEMILKLGEVNSPSQHVQDRLEDLSHKTDLTSEGPIASGLLGSIQSGTLQKGPASGGSGNSSGTSAASSSSSSVGTSGLSTPSSSSQSNIGGTAGSSFSSFDNSATPAGSDTMATPMSATAIPDPFAPNLLTPGSYNAIYNSPPIPADDALSQQSSSQTTAKPLSEPPPAENPPASSSSTTETSPPPTFRSKTPYSQFGNAQNIGGRLSIISPQQAMRAGPAYSNTGQRLNIQGV